MTLQLSLLSRLQQATHSYSYVVTLHKRTSRCNEACYVLTSYLEEQRIGLNCLVHRVFKNGLFLRVDNFATVNGGKACVLVLVYQVT